MWVARVEGLCTRGVVEFACKDAMLDIHCKITKYAVAATMHLQIIIESIAYRQFGGRI